MDVSPRSRSPRLSACTRIHNASQSALKYGKSSAPGRHRSDSSGGAQRTTPARVRVRWVSRSLGSARFQPPRCAMPAHCSTTVDFGLCSRLFVTPKVFCGTQHPKRVRSNSGYIIKPPFALLRRFQFNYPESLRRPSRLRGYRPWQTTTRGRLAPVAADHRGPQRRELPRRFGAFRY
jgi:hypothetical protein